MSNSQSTKNFISEILHYAEKEINFLTDNYELKIETFYIDNKDFILNITRFKSNISPRVFPKLKKQTNDIFSNVYCFESIDNFLNFYSKLLSTVNKNVFYDCSFSLYQFENSYYAIFYTNCINTKYEKTLKYLLSEFSNLITLSSFENIKEFCNLICLNKKFVYDCNNIIIEQF